VANHSKINLHQPDEVKYWTRALTCRPASYKRPYTRLEIQPRQFANNGFIRQRVPVKADCQK
jgi:hypothetical protein